MHDLTLGAPSEQRLLDVIAALYDAVLDPGVWSAVASKTMSHLEARGFFFAGMFPVQECMFRHFEGIAPELQRLFFEKFFHPDANPVARASMSFPPMELVTTDMLVPHAELRESAFYRELVEPAGLHQHLGVNLQADETAMATMAVYRSDRDRTFDEADKQRFRPLLPHFRRAGQLMLKLTALERQQAGQEVLDRLPYAMFLIDAAGRVTVHNSAAREILDQRDGLALRRHQLHADAPGDDETLKRLIREAGLTGARRALFSGGAFTVSRRSGSKSYELLVAPLGNARRLTEEAGHAVAVVFVQDRQKDLVTDEDALRQLYGLTPAECRVARATAAGKDPAQLAELLGLGRSTVRTHLYRVLAKTGTHRQAELVRLLAGGPLALRPPPRPDRGGR